MTGPQDIFISYSTRDRESAEAVCTTLEAAGMRCWIAPRDGVPGTSYAALLVDAISQSRLVLLLFSQAANDSDAVLNELELAANRSIPVLPVRIERIEPQGAAEFYLRRRHWLDAFDDFNAALERIPPAVRSSIAERVTVRSPKAKVRQRNLPRQGTSFIGREAELRAITAMLAEHPLVTIVGPGEQPFAPAYVAVIIPLLVVPVMPKLEAAPLISRTPLPERFEPATASATDGTPATLLDVIVIAPPRFDPCCERIISPVTVPSTLSTTGPTYSPATTGGAVGKLDVLLLQPANATSTTNENRENPVIIHAPFVSDRRHSTRLGSHTTKRLQTG